MHKYLLLINLGPVQGFIATARRTRDLYAGSRLLSEAAREVAEYLLSQGAELIFPAPEKQEDLRELGKSGIPNVILGIVHAENSKQVGSIAETAKQKALSFLEKLAARIFDATKSAAVIRDRRKALVQVRDLLEFYWVVVPLNGDYVEARSRAGRIMSARKSTRNFARASWADSVPKSSLSGDLESITFKAPDSAKRAAGLREGEELSAVDLLKRRYLVEEPRPFASTTLMALLPFLRGLSENESEALEKTLARLETRLETRLDTRIPEHLADRYPLLKRFDSRVFFPSRHRELAKSSHDQRAKEEKPWEHTRRELERFYNEMLKREPYPYYAILLADGDHMGKVIDHQKRIEDHQALSRQLSAFARSVREIVERHDGSLVYSGGDDVLALLPLHTVLACARDLADAFRKQMLNFCTEDEQSPTLSVGIALVHHLFDLGEAFELARQAEKKAKESRNALAVLWSPRSGTETVVQGMWCEGPRALDQRLDEFAEWLHKDVIPAGFAHELREAGRVLSSTQESEGLLEKEAERILKRKDVKDRELVVELQRLIKGTGAERLADELIVARPFARARSLAESKKEAAQ